MWSFGFGLDDCGVPLGKNRFASFKKKHPQEFQLLIARVQSILVALDAGFAFGDILKRGWVHPEKSGVFALDPGRSGVRLYCCLDVRKRKVVLLTIGDKKTQSADVLDSAEWARQLTGEE